MKNNDIDIPRLNETYNCFVDGKIRESRKYTVLIKEVIPFDNIDESTLKIWLDDVKRCYWLYKEETDFFIKTLNLMYPSP